MIAEHYDENVEEWRSAYDRDVRSLAAFDLQNRREAIVRLIDECAGSETLSIIDVGCGSGALMYVLLERGHLTTGIDISPKMVEAARRITESQFPGRSSCLVGDIESMPFDDGSFDCAVYAGVLSHQADVRPTLAEAARVVADDGFIVVTLPNYLLLRHVFDPRSYFRMVSHLLRGLWPSSQRRRTDLRRTPRSNRFIVRKFRYGEIPFLFAGSGLAIRRIDYYTFGPLTLWNRQVLPVSWSLRLSHLLERLARRSRFALLRQLPGGWVVVLEKADTG